MIERVNIDPKFYQNMFRKINNLVCRKKINVISFVIKAFSRINNFVNTHFVVVICEGAGIAIYTFCEYVTVKYKSHVNSISSIVLP